MTLLNVKLRFEIGRVNKPLAELFLPKSHQTEKSYNKIERVNAP